MSHKVLHNYAKQVANALISEEYERKLYDELIARFKHVTTIDDPDVEAALEAAIENDFQEELRLKREIVAAVIEALAAAESVKQLADMFKTEQGQVLLRVSTAAQVALDEYSETSLQSRIDKLQVIFAKAVDDLKKSDKN
jgi:MFS superfamily sulfate permease-like transporter